MFRRLHPASSAAVPLPPQKESASLDPNTDPDPGLGDPISRYGNSLLHAEDLKGFEAFYRRQQGDGRIILLEGCAKNPAHDEILENWGLKDRANPVAQLFAGANYSHRAWEARGGKLASAVGQGQWQLFSMWLAEAAKCLEIAIRLDPQSPEAYHRMIRVLVGDADLSKRTYLDYYKDLRKLRPDHLPAAMDVLTQKTEKWGGSHAEMFGFVKELTGDAKAGSLLYTLVPMSHIERMVYYVIQNDYEGANAYMRQDKVRAELAHAYSHSVASPQLAITPLTPILYNWMAAALIYSNSKEGRKECLEKMGDRVTDRPWAYISMPVYGLVNELRGDFGLPLL